MPGWCWVQGPAAMPYLSNFLALALSQAIAASAVAATSLFQPAADATLHSESALAANGSGTGMFAGNTAAGHTRRALIRFQFPGIPAGARIDSVTLTLKVTKAATTDLHLVRLHRLADAWGEGPSASGQGGGAAAGCGDSTWTHAVHSTGAGCSFAARAWLVPGGDFDPAHSATAMVGGIGSYSWSDARMADDVRAWLSGAAPNHGWILTGDESAPLTARRFDSRESLGAKPQLTVVWSLPPPPPELQQFLVQPEPSGATRITVSASGVAGARYSLSRSTDLVAWADEIAAVADSTGLIRLEFTEPASAVRRYYRLLPE